MRRISVVALLLAAVLAASFGLIAYGQDTYAQGLMDGQLAGGIDAPYLAAGLWGFVSGLFYLIYVAVTEPAVAPEVLIHIQGKPEIYQLGYLKGYKQAKQRARYIGGGAGWSIWLLILLGASS